MGVRGMGVNRHCSKVVKGHGSKGYGSKGAWE